MAEEVVKILKIETEGAAQTVKDLKNEITGLRDALVNTTKGSEEYNKIVEKLVDDQKKLTDVMRAGKDEMKAAEGSYNALQNEMTALRKVWKETTDVAKRDEIGKRINEINTQLKEMDATIGNSQRKVGSYEEALKKVLKTPQQELRELRKELAGLEAGTDEYNRVFTRMAQLTHDVREQQELLRYSSADLGDMISNLTGIAQGFAGGISAINAAIGLMGDENEDVQKALLKTQRFVQLIQGLGALEELPKRIKGLGKGIKEFLANMGGGANKIGEFAKNTEQASDSATKMAGGLEKTQGAATGAATALDTTTKTVEKLKKAFDNATGAEKRLLRGLINSEIDKYAEDLSIATKQEILFKNETNDLSKVIEGQARILEDYSKEELLLGEKNGKLLKANLQLKDSLKDLNKWQILSRTAAKAQIKSNEALIASNSALAFSFKAVATALKVLKAALATIGIGLIITLISGLVEILGKGLGNLWEWATGTKAMKEAFDAETKSIENLQVAMERHIEFLKAQGKNTYEIFAQQLKDLDTLDAKLMMHYNNAVEKFKKNSDEIKEAREAWEKNTEKTAETVADIVNSIEEMASEIEKADRQSGMTQLEKDVEDLNVQFAAAITLLQEMGKAGKLSAETVDAYIKRLQEDLPKAIAQLKAKNNGGNGGKSVWEKEEDEIKRLLEGIKDYGKTEEQVLTETFNHNYNLLKKHHKDTTLLEKKYKEDLLKIREETANKTKKLVELRLQNDRDFIMKGNEEWYKADIALKKKSLDNLKQGLDESDEEFRARQIKAEEEYMVSQNNYTAFINKQSELKLQNQRDIIKTGAREWYEADVALKKAQLENLVQGMDESLEEFENRKIEALKSYGDAVSALKSYDKNEEGLSQINNAEAVGGEYGRDSIEYFNARLDAAKWYRDNLLQMEDETNEEFRARQIAANNEVIEIDRALAQRRIENSTMMADGIASVLGSIADAYEDDIKAQIENGKISQEEGEKRFEQVKGMQIAVATIQMLSGIAAALSGVFTTKTGPWDIALAAVQAASIAASGIAQITKIKNTKLGSISSNASTSYAVATPTMPNDYSPTYTENITGEKETEDLKNALATQPIWVSVSDIDRAQNRVQVRENESSF